MSGSTVNRYLSFISAVLTDAVHRRKLQHVPHMPRQKEGECRILWLTEDEEAMCVVKALFREYREVADATAAFSDTGMRMGELWPLFARQVDFEAGLLLLEPRQTKTNRGRALPITNRMSAILRPRVTNGGLVLPEFSTEGFHRRFVKIAKAAGLESVVPYTADTHAAPVLYAGGRRCSWSPNIWAIRTCRQLGATLALHPRTGT